MKVLFVHAHFDDFEFTAAGTFELWRQQRGEEVQRRVLICTDGASGHQFRTRAETGRMRYQEQEASARIGGYEFQMLRLPNGEVPREACLQSTPEVLAALWKAIRDFEPDYLFCPPYPSNPLAGIHIDHVAVADAVRKVAYLINVPHVFTPEYPADETKSAPCKTPVILNLYDPYTAGANAHDLAVDIGPVFDKVCEMSWCHQSQILEWLPWVGRHNMEPPQSVRDWSRILMERLQRRNHEMGINASSATEYFTVTGWGEMPEYERIVRDFPNLFEAACHLDLLKAKLRTYGTQ